MFSIPFPYERTGEKKKKENKSTRPLLYDCFLYRASIYHFDLVGRTYGLCSSACSSDTISYANTYTSV